MNMINHLKNKARIALFLMPLLSPGLITEASLINNQVSQPTVNNRASIPSRAQELPIILNGHNGHVYSVAWSSNSNCLVSGSSDKTIRIWNAKNGHILYIVGREYGQLSLKGARFVGAIGLSDINKRLIEQRGGITQDSVKDSVDDIGDNPSDQQNTIVAAYRTDHGKNNESSQKLVSSVKGKIKDSHHHAVPTQYKKKKKKEDCILM